MDEPDLENAPGRADHGRSGGTGGMADMRVPQTAHWGHPLRSAFRAISRLGQEETSNEFAASLTASRVAWYRWAEISR